nr:hypothetical protein [Tanacetum cinerariifolium]
MIEKNFIEIKGTFLVRIHDNVFKGMDEENVFDHINGFLEVVGPLKVRQLSHDRFRHSVFSISLSGAASELFRNEYVGTISTWDDLVENFVQKFYNLFDHNEEEEVEMTITSMRLTTTYEEYEQKLNNDKTQGLNKQWPTNRVPYQLCHHICKPYCFNNIITKWTTCSSVIDGYCNRGKLHGMVRVGRMTYFQDHKWYDNSIDGCLKQETLIYKARIEGS